MIEILVKWGRGKDGKVAVAAAKELLNRGYGLPVQAVEHTGTGGGPIVLSCGDSAR